MKIEVASCTVKSIHGATSLTVGGTSYEADKNGHLEIAQEHLPAAQSHGFALVDGEKHDGKVEIVATGHDPDKTPAQNEAAQAADVTDYADMTRDQLIELAKTRGVEVETDANKKALIAALEANDTDDQSEDAVDYDAMTKKDLIDLAEERGVEVGSKATKEEIITALVAADEAAKSAE